MLSTLLLLLALDTIPVTTLPSSCIPSAGFYGSNGITEVFCQDGQTVQLAPASSTIASNAPAPSPIVTGPSAALFGASDPSASDPVGVAPVPEPANLVLFGSGMLLLGAWWYRRGRA